MRATDALRASLRDLVGPAARSAGFRGSGGTWRATSPDGDVAVVNVQSSVSSSASAARCIVNVAVAPAPWLDLVAVQRGRPVTSVGQADGLYWDRVHPSPTAPQAEGWWVVTGSADADVVAHDLVRRLQSPVGFSLLTDLLDRGRLLEHVRAGDLGFRRRADLDPAYGDRYFSRAEAVLLADEGPGARLDELLDRPDRLASPAEQQSGFDFAAWIRDRAQRSAATRARD